MDCKVENVWQLYDDALRLYKNVVLEDGNAIIMYLYQGIEILKKSWQGIDAGVQIQNVINVYNAMVNIRNILANLAKDSSIIACNYRLIQKANGGNLDDLYPISVDFIRGMDNYTDTRDMISITIEAREGQSKLEAANFMVDQFINNVRSSYDSIMNNWQVGNGRDMALYAFNDFMKKSEEYQQTLNEVSKNISASLDNYDFQSSIRGE